MQILQENVNNLSFRTVLYKKKNQFANKFHEKLFFKEANNFIKTFLIKLYSFSVSYSDFHHKFKQKNKKNFNILCEVSS